MCKKVKNTSKLLLFMLESTHCNERGSAMTELDKEKETKLGINEDLVAGFLIPFNRNETLNSQNESRLSTGESYYRLGKLYYDKSDLKTARMYFEEALKLCSNRLYFFFEFKVLGFLIRISSELLDSQSFDSYVQRSNMIVDRYYGKEGGLTAEVFYNMGISKTYCAMFEESVQNFKLAVSESKKEEVPEVLVKSYYALAAGYYQKKDFELALTYLGELRMALKTIKKDYLQGSMNLLYGNIYSELGNFDTAMDYYQQAHSCLVAKSCWNLNGYILLRQGMAEKRKGAYTKSFWYFQMARQCTDEQQFLRLHQLIREEINSVNDSSVDICLDKRNRIVQEKTLGCIDFKHRFVLLEILFLLAREPGVYYTKNQLVDLIWGNEYNPMIHDKLIYTSISRLRKLIEPQQGRRKYIIRDRNGYLFSSHVNVRIQADTEVNFQSSVDISSPV